MLEKSEKAALFLRLRLSSTLIRHENGAFWKTLLKPEEFKNAGFAFLGGQETIWKMTRSENDEVTIVTWFPCPSFVKHKSKKTGDCSVFKFIWLSVDGKHLMRADFRILWPGWTVPERISSKRFILLARFSFFLGIGFASIAVSFLVSVYYNVIMAWSLFYFYQAFKKDIPWVGCHHPWNTPDCYIFNASNPNASGVSPSREFLV